MKSACFNRLVFVVTFLNDLMVMWGWDHMQPYPAPMWSPCTHQRVKSPTYWDNFSFKQNPTSTLHAPSSRRSIWKKYRGHRKFLFIPFVVFSYTLSTGGSLQNSFRLNGPGGWVGWDVRFLGPWNGSSVNMGGEVTPAYKLLHVVTWKEWVREIFKCLWLAVPW